MNNFPAASLHTVPAGIGAGLERFFQFTGKILQ
jgi:hypothetical protein